MSFLIDACVISELRKETPNTAVLAWFDSIYDEEIFISVLTIGEIEYGISILDEGKKKARIMEWFENVKFGFQDQTVTVSLEIASRCGRISGELKQQGRNISALDGLLAATAIDKDFLLVTRNVADFQDSGVRLFNPWDYSLRE